MIKALICICLRLWGQDVAEENGMSLKVIRSMESLDMMCKVQTS